jgi:eukaryotic-like serine/threonine-protein kinase
LTTGTGQEQTKDSPRPVRPAEGQPSGSWGPARTGELVGGKYRISRFLAEGGMGVVYEAQHAIVKRRFAVKFLRPDFVNRRESLGRFQREAEAAGSLESEHIASVVDFGITNDGSPYIVMEYLVGESLACLLRREGRLPVQRAADLCMQACHGAETAHAAGIVHRDLKPHNLFMCRRDDSTDLLKILDFGIAKLDLLKHDQVSTQTGTVLGTPAYMSPEQARGDRTIDLRTDVYSLGAILYEMLSGQLPHPGDSRNAVLYHIASQPSVSLAVVAPGVPRPLVDLVDRALSSSPGVRSPSARAFAADLARFAKRQAWPEPPSLQAAPFPAASRSSLEGVADASTAEPAMLAGEPVAQVKGMAATVPAPRPIWLRLAIPTAVIALVASAGMLSSRLLRTARVSPELASPASKNHLQVAPASEPAQRPAQIDSTPASSLASGSATPPRAPEVVRVPAETPPFAQPAPARHTGERPVAGVVRAAADRSGRSLERPVERPSGRPVERPSGRPVERPSGRSVERRSDGDVGRAAATAPQTDGARPGAMAPTGRAKAANGSFPAAIFDSHNPYASP